MEKWYDILGYDSLRFLYYVVRSSAVLLYPGFELIPALRGRGRKEKGEVYYSELS